MSLVDKSLERRNFLKGTAAAVGALAAAGLAGCAPSEDPKLSDTGSSEMNRHVVESDEIIASGEGKWITADCWGNCGGRCVNKVLVKDGVVVRQKTHDDFDDSVEMPQQRSCPRGHKNRQTVFSASRIKYPMKRKSWQPGGGENAHGEMRGEDSWERLSWDEALDLVASEIKRVYDDHGPRSVLCTGNDWNELFLMGGRLQWDGNQSYGNWYNAPNRIGTSVGNGFPDGLLTNDRTDLVNADTIVMYGLNSAWMSAGNPSHLYKLAQEAGVQFVHVGPDYNVTASMLGSRWIRVRPGTDTVFLLAVAYEMLRLDEEKGNVVDLDFLHKYCVGFDADSMPADAKLNENFKDYVLGAYDDTPKTPEWATKICGTPVEDITWFAEMNAKTNNVMLLHSYAPSRYCGSIDLSQLFLTIACMGGHLGKSGNAAGSVFSTESANGGPALVKVGAPTQANTATNELENPEIVNTMIWRDIVRGHYTCWGGMRGGPHDNGWENEDGTFRGPKEYDIDVKMIVNDFHNPLQSYLDVNTGIQAFKKVETVINIDYRYTLTSQYSDIILPCFTCWEGNLDPEKGEVDVAYNGMMRLSRFQHNRDYALYPSPVTTPLFESRNEDWIHREICKRLDLDSSIVYPINAMQCHFDKIAGSEVIAEDGVTYKPLVTITQEDIDAWGVEGTPQEGVISLKDLLAQGYYQVPRTANDNCGSIAYADYIADPEANPRPSASGKLEIYCQSKADGINALEFNKDELKPYPTYHPTTYEKTFSDFEAGVKGQYPYMLQQPHYLRRSHTEYDEGVWGREAFPNPLFISAEDAKEKGVQTGDTVLVFNDAGKMLRIASVVETLVPGSVLAPHGPRSYIDPETGIDLGGNENVLTNHDIADEFFPHTNGYNSCLVDFEKYDGEPLAPDYTFEPALWTEE